MNFISLILCVSPWGFYHFTSTTAVNLQQLLFQILKLDFCLSHLRFKFTVGRKLFTAQDAVSRVLKSKYIRISNKSSILMTRDKLIDQGFRSAFVMKNYFVRRKS